MRRINFLFVTVLLVCGSAACKKASNGDPVANKNYELIFGKWILQKQHVVIPSVRKQSTPFIPRASMIMPIFNLTRIILMPMQNTTRPAAAISGRRYWWGYTDLRGRHSACPTMELW